MARAKKQAKKFFVTFSARTATLEVKAKNFRGEEDMKSTKAWAVVAAVSMAFAILLQQRPDPSDLSGA